MLARHKKVKRVDQRNYSNNIAELQVQCMINSTELLDLILDAEIVELEPKNIQPNMLELVVADDEDDDD